MTTASAPSRPQRQAWHVNMIHMTHTIRHTDHMLHVGNVRIGNHLAPVLQSTTPVLLQYYSVLQSTTPVLLRTTQYYSSTTPVLQTTTPVLLCTTKHYSSTTLYYKVLLQYHSVLQSTTPILLCTTKYYSLYYKVRICKARSNRCHPPTSPNIAPATQNDSHD